MNLSEVILAVGAHPDDVDLMCGGTLARKASEGVRVHILTIADGVTSRDKGDCDERLRQAGRAAHVLGATFSNHGFPDNQLDTVPLLTIVKCIEDEVRRVKPTTLYTHHPSDLNIDHRIVSEAAIVASRPASSVKLILFGEVPSATDYQVPYVFTPNWFEDISMTIGKKLEALACYADEMREFPHVRSERAIKALATYRGAMISCHAAEGFVLGRKIA